MEKRKAFYVVDNYDETEHIEWDESYCMLRGPGGFECLLTEPEDRSWYRDGKKVVDKLNALEAENAALKATREEIVRETVEKCLSVVQDELERLRALAPAPKVKP